MYSTVAVSRYFKEDPVHMTMEGYVDLGQQLIEKIGSSAVKRKTTGKAAEAQSSQIDWAARRSRWIRENDTTVRRADTDESRGQGYRGRWPPCTRGHQGKHGGGYRGWRGQGNKCNPY
jgi:radical SAM superfamily enzyme